METTTTLPQLHEIYYQLLDSIDVGIHVVNTEGRSVIYNKKMSEIEDMEKEDVINKNILDIFLFQSEEESRLFQALRKGKITKNSKQTYFNFKGQEITTVNETFPLIFNNEILGAVEIAKDITKLEKLTRERARDKPVAKYTFDQIIGESETIKRVIHSAKKATRTNSSVLIAGETGTGKELFAQSIHNGSARSSKPFISQNCAALPNSLIEGILFGTTRGAFTGSIDHPGLFEQADGGTLMLDEINTLNLPLQAKLLRAIQEKTIRRIGDTKDRPIDVRIIATINKDPLEAIENNELREDLYYRLSVVSIIVPPLRQRKEDIPLLVNHFIEKYNQRFQLSVPSLNELVLDLFFQYDWPGNIRELEHIIEGSMNLINYDEEIDISHLPVHVRNKFPLYETFNPAPSFLVKKEGKQMESLQAYMAEAEKHYIEQALNKHRGNITQTAKALGLSRQSLQYRIKKYELEKTNKK